jgi:hypothetical protein
LKRKIFLSISMLSLLLACKSIALPTTPTSVVPLPEIILSEVLRKLDGCYSVSGVEVKDNTYSFSCSNSADTYYSVSMTGYNSEATAHTQFESSRGDNPKLCFHGYDLYETSSTNPRNQYIVVNQLHWQAGQWVISIYASYDYGYFHFFASDFSEAVYASSIEHDLFLSGKCPTAGTTSPMLALTPTSSSP